MIAMKRIFTLFFLLPAICFAQVSPKNKTAEKAKTAAGTVQRPDGGFIINGDVKGFAEGTQVSLLNGQTGVSESETTLKGGKFVFTGKMDKTDFKIIIFNMQPPYITLFLDNSAVKITGTKETIDKATVTGSKSHTDFADFSSSLEPYTKVFSEAGGDGDSVMVSKAMNITTKFAQTHPNSAIAPLAIIRFNQLADDITRTEKLYNALAPEIKATTMGNYINNMINDEKKLRGVQLGDFSQTDTSGKAVSLSSFRGRYVLLDFWASWCGPCRQENPNVVQAYNKYKNKNFTVLGVSLDKTKDAWLNAIHMDNLTWTHVSDLQGWGNTVAQQYQILSIPQNYLIDPQGKVVGKNLRGPALERKLARILR